MKQLQKAGVFAFVVCLFLAGTLAVGQGIVTGSISGTVVDPQGAVVPNAPVTAVQVDTQREFTAKTNEQGYFSFRSLPVGNYNVTVSPANMGKVQLNNVVVSTAKDTSVGELKAQLQATEVVEVEGTAPIIETSTAQLSATFSSTKVAGLPNAGGGFDSLALFVPGVVQNAGAAFGNTNGASISSNGQRGRSNNFQIDGQANNDNSVTGPGMFVNNPDALQEFQIVTSNFGAEYGRNLGSVVNYVTKSGTNAYHGTAFNYYTGNWSFSRRNQDKNTVFGFCDRANPANSPPGCTYPHVPKYVENRFGGSFGGPVVKDRLWFFGTYQKDLVHQGGSPSSSSTLTPTPRGITQLEAAFGASNPGVVALKAFGPYAIAVGNPTPGTPVTQNVTVGAVTAPVEFATVTRFLPSIYDEDEWLVRGDWQATNNDRIFGRFIREKFSNSFATGQFAAGTVVDVPGESYAAGLDYTRTWTPAVITQFRVSFTHNRFAFEAGTIPTCTVANINTCPPSVGFTSGVDLNFGMQSNLPQDRNVNNWQYQSNNTWSVGRHTIKFGGSYDRQRSPSSFLPNINGTFTYTTFNSFMANTPTTLSLADGPVAFNFREQDVAFYFQDDWRVKDNFTFQYGVRWEWNEQAINLLSDITRANQAQSPAFWSTTAPEAVTLLPYIPEDLNNFAPNVGFAWTPRIWQGLFGEDKTVIRGGYRIAYDPAFYNIFLNVATAAPVVNLGTISGAALAPGLTGTTGDAIRTTYLPALPRGSNPGGRAQTRVTPDFHNPYTQQWNLSIQRQITPRIGFETRYVGNHTIGQFMTRNGNPLIATVAGGVATPLFPLPAGVTPCTTTGAPGIGRPDCNFSLLRVRTNDAYSIYHGWQNRFDITNFHGLTAGASYTWSKTIDNVSEIFASGGGASSVIAQNPFDVTVAERGESAFSYPHVASFYGIYDIPAFRNQEGFVGRVFGGWQVSGTWRYQTGEAFNPIQSTQNANCDTLFNNSFIGRDSCRPILSNPNAPIEDVGRYVTVGGVNRLVNNSTCVGAAGGATCPFVTASDVHWIINSTLASTINGTPFAGVGRNFLRGQSRNNLDVGVQKTFRITEGVSFQTRIDYFNVLNRMFRGVPGTNVNARNLRGLIAGTAPGTTRPQPGSFMNQEFNGSNRRFAQIMVKIIF